MKNFRALKNCLIVFSMVICLALSFFAINTSRDVGVEELTTRAVAPVMAYTEDLTNASTRLKRGSTLSKLTTDDWTSEKTVPLNSAFTLQFNNSYLPSSTDVEYTFSLITSASYGTSEEVNTQFPIGTRFNLLDYSNAATSSVTYLKTLERNEPLVPLSEFSYGATPYTPGVVEGELNNECLQIIVNFVDAASLPADGTYIFVLYRQVNGGAKVVAGKRTITFANITTTFSLAVSSPNTTVVGDSYENFSLVFTPSNNNASALNGQGSGVRLRINAQSVPSSARMTLLYGGVQQGDDIGLEKSFAFDFTQSSSMTASVMIPSNAGLPTTTYGFIFEVFDSAGTIIATNTIQRTFVNANYRMKATTYVRTDSDTYTKSIVYHIGTNDAVVCDIVEDLPSTALVDFSIERRLGNQHAYTTYKSYGWTNLTVSSFRSSLTVFNLSGLTSGYECVEDFEEEMVLRFNFIIRDAGGNVQFTTCSYVVVADDSKLNYSKTLTAGSGQLVAPKIAVSGNTLTITCNPDADEYYIYAAPVSTPNVGVVLDTVTTTSSNTTVTRNLATLLQTASIAGGKYIISVVAGDTSNTFTDSEDAYVIYKYSRTMVAPSLSLSGDTLNITWNDTVVPDGLVKIYANNTLISTVAASTTSLNLESLITTAGSYTIYAVATKDAYNLDSAHSSSVAYVVS
ncbi:MAG: hypothetical protein IJS68_01110 [Clostridia bacterium]|nr:hypothetical protein [Clostridia bacterium]